MEGREAGCWECGLRFTPTFPIIPNYYVTCPRCMERLTILAVKAIQSGRVREEDYENLPEPGEIQKEESHTPVTEAPIMEAA